jgi:hypothetical protein
MVCLTLDLFDCDGPVALQGGVDAARADTAIVLGRFRRHRRRWGVRRKLAGQEVVPRAAIDQVIVESAGQQVVPRAAEDQVPAEPADDRIRSLAAVANIVPHGQGEEVVTAATVDNVVARTRENLVIAGTGEDDVVAAGGLDVAEEGGGVAQDQVVATEGEDNVVAEQGAEEVRPLGPFRISDRLDPMITLYWVRSMSGGTAQSSGSSCAPTAGAPITSAAIRDTITRMARFLPAPPSSV